jgi:hypothetical protein
MMNSRVTWHRYPESIPTGENRELLMVIGHDKRLQHVVLGWWHASAQCFAYEQVEDANSSVVGWMEIPNMETFE